jgi:hypothetical protein
LIVLSLLVLALGGCANGYQQFYHFTPGVTPELIAQRRAAPPPATPLVDHIPAFNKSVLENYAKHGYALIGYSAFNSGLRQPDDFAITQGRAVGADLVVIANPRYTGTTTSSVPFTTNVPITTTGSSTSYSSGSATAFGSRGFATVIGSGITTTDSSSTTWIPQTTYIPITINHQDYGAAYFIKTHSIFGTRFRDLNDSERQSMQTNKGVVIIGIINDSPAFNADILMGDIITGINGHAVTDVAEFSSALKANAGRTVTFSILRDQKHLEKSVQLLR